MGFIEYTRLKEADNSSFQHSTDLSDDFVICKNPFKLHALLQKICPDKSIHYVSDGDWSMHDLVMELLKKYNKADLYITTYALREFPVRQLILAQEKGDIKSIKMLLDYRAKTRTPEVFQLAGMNIGSIFLTSIHAKVTVIKSPAGYISIVGSANWTQNPRIECGVISLNKELAEFHIGWIEKIMSNAEIFE